MIKNLKDGLLMKTSAVGEPENPDKLNACQHVVNGITA